MERMNGFRMRYLQGNEHRCPPGRSMGQRGMACVASFVCRAMPILVGLLVVLLASRSALANEVAQRSTTTSSPTIEAPTRKPLVRPTNPAARSPELDAASALLPPPQAAPSQPKKRSVAQRHPRWYAERLGVVLAIFAALVFAHRVLAGSRQFTLPAGAIEVCGKVPFDAKRSLHLVRVGSRLLVLLESAQGIQRLAEITDPQEVQRLLCDGPAAMNARERWFLADDQSDTTPSVAQVLAEFRDLERSGTAHATR
jgi:flagellar biogenesis protein FliO